MSERGECSRHALRQAGRGSDRKQRDGAVRDPAIGDRVRMTPVALLGMAKTGVRLGPIEMPE